MDIISTITSKILTKDITLFNYLLIVYVCSKLPILYGMGNITTEEVMENIDLFQSRFGKLDEFGCWYLEQIQTDSVAQFTSKEFEEVISVRGVQLTLAELDECPS